MDETKEITVSLSEDKRFLEQVSKVLKRYEDARKEAASKLTDPAFRLRRMPYDRLEEQDLTLPSAFAKEYELCLRRMSAQPAAIRALVLEIGNTALHAHAVALAKETEKKEPEQ